MAKRSCEMIINQEHVKIKDLVLSNQIFLEVDVPEDIDVITNLIMKYGKGKVDVTTKYKNYEDESEE